MAEIVAPVVLESLINVMTHEANLLSGAKDQVDLLKGDLRVMNAFLKDCAGKQESNHVVKEIVDQISDVALEAEDVIDTYMADKILKQRRRNPMIKLFHLPGHAKTIHEVATKTASIKTKISNIYANKATYGINEAESSSAAAEAGQRIQKMRRKVEEDDVVGFVHDTQKLVSQLIEDCTNNLKRHVFSIVGIGGLGKTTLAKKIYNHTNIKNHFGCRVWVNVSQEYKSRNLFLDILKSLNVPISDETSKMDDEVVLGTTLHRYLKGKRYFVVMDDIWDTDVWEEIRDAFPDELKLCFLYLGMFPEDYEIRTRDLINLWISKRFVHQIGNRKVSDVAEDYLEELIDRSLIQVASRGNDGSVGTCRIHDLLRDLCIKVSGQEKLFDVHSEANNHLSSPVKPRRLSVNCKSTQYIISRNAAYDKSSARSLLFFCQNDYFKEMQWEWICKGFKFIRVLMLFDVCGSSSIPKEIQKFVFLRHLSLNNYDGGIIFPGEKVPNYICSLPYLETLELQCEQSLTFSEKSISRMKQLRYLDGREFRILADDQRERGGNVDMDTLPNLQAFKTIEVDRHTASFLPKFPNLTELSLCRVGVEPSDVEKALASLEKKLRYLQRLYLHDFRDCLQVVLPSTLTKVTLLDSTGTNMMKTLAKLPNLLHLLIKKNSRLSTLDISVGAGEFPQLQVFQLIGIDINSWEMERDGIPNLQRLIIINRFDEKIQVPNQVWFLRALRFVKIETAAHSADSFRNQLWKLNYVKDEIVDEFKRNWELTMINGCKVALSG